jgi:hypothetical protein
MIDFVSGFAHEKTRLDLRRGPVGFLGLAMLLFHRLEALCHESQAGSLWPRFDRLESLSYFLLVEEAD